MGKTIPKLKWELTSCGDTGKVGIIVWTNSKSNKKARSLVKNYTKNVVEIRE